MIAEATDEEKPKKEWIIKGKRRENIAASVESLPLSKDLVTLRADTPIEFDLDACRLEKFTPRSIEPAVRELGFNRLLDEVKALTGNSVEAPKTTKKAKIDDGGFGGLFDQADDDAKSTWSRATTRSCARRRSSRNSSARSRRRPSSRWTQRRLRSDRCSPISWA